MRSRYFVLTAKQGHQTNRHCEGALRRGWGWRSVAERVPRSPSVDAFVARSATIIFHSWRIKREPVAAASNASRAHPPCCRGFFSRRRLHDPGSSVCPLLSTSSTIHGQHLADSEPRLHLRLIARTPIFPQLHLLLLAKRGNASLRADAQHFIRM